DKYNSQGSFEAAIGQFATDTQFNSAIQAFNQAVLNNLGAAAIQGQQADAATAAQNSGATAVRAIGAVGDAAAAVNSLLGPNNEPPATPKGENVGGTSEVSTTLSSETT